MPSKWIICGHFSYDKLEGVTRYCKIVILGDKSCGKTTLVENYGAEIVEQPRSDAGCESARKYRAHCDIRAHPGVQLEIWDYSGGPSPGLNLPSDVDVILLCLDVSRPETLDDVTKQWLRVIRDQCPHQGLILVGCKCDLRNDLNTISQLAQKRQIAVTFNQASKIARIAGALAYVETSAKRSSNTVQQLFEVAALHHVGKLSRRHLVFQRQRSVQKHETEATRCGLRKLSQTLLKLRKPKCCII